MEKKKGNENKIILRDFHCTMDRMDRDDGNKTQIIYKFHSNYILSKLIVDNMLEECRRENLDSSDFTHYDTSSGTRSRIDRVYADIKFASNTKINHLMVYFTEHYNSICINRNRKLKFKAEIIYGKLKLKLENVHGALIIFFYGSVSFSYF